MRSCNTITAFAVTLAIFAPAAAPMTMAAQDALEGWEMRFDREGSGMDDVDFMPMAPGFHVTTGPAMIAYHPDSIAGGDYWIEAETFLFDPGERREAFGIFIGGEDLQGPGQRYTYFLIREGGEFLVKTREGEGTEEVQGWTAHPEVVSYRARPDGDETAKNVLAVQAAGDELRFFVNGAQVWSGPRSGLVTDGVFGLRVNHGLNLHVTRVMSKTEY